MGGKEVVGGGQGGKVDTLARRQEEEERLVYIVCARLSFLAVEWTSMARYHFRRF